MKLVNTSPGTSVMMEPEIMASTFTSSPVSRAAYTTSASTKPAAAVFTKKLDRDRRPSTSVVSPAHRPASPPRAASSSPPEKKSVKKKAPARKPSSWIYMG